MDFHTYASTETTTLIGQLLANRSGAALHQLNAVRDALDAVARALEVPGHVGEDVHELVDRLTRASAADVQRIRDEAAAALEAAHAELRAGQEAREKLADTLAAAESDAAALRSDLQLARTRCEGLEADLRTGAETQDDLQAALKSAEADLVQLADARHALEAELAHAQSRVQVQAARIDALEEQLRDRAQHEERIRELTAHLDEARQNEARLQERLATRAEAQADGAEVEVLRAEVDRMVSLLDASARAVTDMAAATTSTGLLTELLKRLSLQFSRVALFRVKGNRLEGEQQIGFDDATDVTKLAFPVGVESILSRAVSSGQVESITGEETAARTGTPFGGAPRAAVALPILLQGSAFAVVYADDSEMPDWARGPAVHESSLGFARLLVGQVSVLMLRHTHELKTLGELRHYATTLLQEAKEMYLADAQAGKARDLLRMRLKDNLECASQLYAYRAAMEGTAAATLLDEQIAEELEQSSPFAEDLAKVVAQLQAGDLQVTAEAS